MSDDDPVDRVIDALDPQPVAESLPVSRRQTLRALASVGALGSVGSASAQSAGTVVADEAVFSNYGWESSADGGTLTIDGDEYTFDGSEEIGLPDGGVGTEVVTPDGSASEVIGPSGQVLWAVGQLFEQTTMSHARQYHTTAVVDGQPYVFGGDDGTDTRATAEYYDGSTWVSLPDMSHPRQYHTTAVVDGQPYVFGGDDGTGTRATAEYAGEPL